MIHILMRNVLIALIGMLTASLAPNKQSMTLLLIFYAPNAKKDFTFLQMDLALNVKIPYPAV